MLGIVSHSTRQRDLDAARVQKVSMRSFASTINKPMLFQISDELPNLARHTNNTIGAANCQELLSVICSGVPDYVTDRSRPALRTIACQGDRKSEVSGQIAVTGIDS